MSAALTRTLPAVLLAAAALAVLAAPALACEGSNAHAGQASDAHLLRATLCLLNTERTHRGIGRLRLNPRLSDAAERHSRDMVRHRYFTHDSLSGATFVDRIRRTGYLRSAQSWSVAENLAWGSGRRATPAAIVRSWMSSPPHRANVLAGRFDEVGVGLAPGAPARTRLPAATYTTDFGTRG
jgi:uncharacterized protein YkwD